MSPELKKRLEANAKVNFAWFESHVAQKGYTIEQLRCDVRPTGELIELMNRLGLGQYERWVTKYSSTVGTLTSGGFLQGKRVRLAKRQPTGGYLVDLLEDAAPAYPRGTRVQVGTGEFKAGW